MHSLLKNDQPEKLQPLAKTDNSKFESEVLPDHMFDIPSFESCNNIEKVNTANQLTYHNQNQNQSQNSLLAHTSPWSMQQPQLESVEKHGIHGKMERKLCETLY
jgi:hypothetical protein